VGTAIVDGSRLVGQARTVAALELLLVAAEAVTLCVSCCELERC